MTTPRHFLELSALTPEVLRGIVDAAAAFKRGEPPGGVPRPLPGRCLAMIFDKPSTRTRVSFEAAMLQLGGDAIVLSSTEMQIGRGETIEDTARVLSRYVDAIMMRTAEPQTLHALADQAGVPVINGLTKLSHPCQLMADMLTFEEYRGPIKGRVVAWSGDGNNMAHTWIEAAAQFGFEIRVAAPKALRPSDSVVAWALANGALVTITDDPEEVVRGADCVVTDTWVSMGFEGEDDHRRLLGPYRVDERLMSLAGPQAIFMHCLPAHRGDEVTSGVIDGPQSVVWDEAENRLHAQKGILHWCLA